jgi:hypothetical protein
LLKKTDNRQPTTDNNFTLIYHQKKAHLTGSVNFALTFITAKKVLMSHPSKVLTAALLLVAAAFSSITAQTVTVKGTVQDTLNQSAIPGVEVRLASVSYFTGNDGAFSFQFNAQGRFVLSLAKPGYRTKEITLVADGKPEINLGTIDLYPQESTDQLAAEDLIPTITLTTDESQTLGSENISGILTASRDLFASTAAFVFGPARFQIRGYRSDYTSVLFNGVSVNDPETGGIFWSNWGGLNDVTRTNNVSIGLAPTDYAFGSVGGASIVDTRASYQRKQLRVSYARSNRTYLNRLMLTWSSGLLPGGWAVSLSGSRRWGQEGYVAGTYYDAWAYFMSVDKKLGDKHTLNLTFFGAPVRRGKTAGAVQELYDLAGTNYYNPNWGYQNGKVRNSKEARTHQPMAILRHDWQIAPRTTLTTAASWQFGRDGDTALDWYDARDPRPDYYRRLPSFYDPEQAALIEQLYLDNPDLLQVDWDYLYNVNYGSTATIQNADGIPGNTVTGLRSQYIVEDRRADRQVANINTWLQHKLGKRVSLVGGLSYQWFKNHNYKLVDDLLGGEFYLDIDKFAELDNPLSDPDFYQNDLETPNRLVREGDSFGYDYNTHSRRAGGWAQANFGFTNFDFFAAANATQVSYWREGLVRNGRFPNNSLGESDKADFLEFGGKAGLTYKLNGRNYLVLNGGYSQRAPFMRNIFVSPRSRNDLAEDLRLEKILSAEGGYLLKSPYVKAKLMAYYTQFQDQLYTRSFYLDDAIDIDEGGFVNYIMNGIDSRHAGIEVAGEVTVLPGLKLNAVAAVGQYIYTNRPEVTVYSDISAAKLSDHIVYTKNFYIPNTPQSAYTFGINYNAKRFWFVNLNFNYFDNIWIDIYPERRTSDAVAGSVVPDVEPGTPLWNSIINQEKAPGAFTMDFFGGKSWKFGDVYLYLNVGVSNLLDNKEFKVGGYEQFRFDFEEKNVNKFPNRYFYGYGRTYFISLAARI